MEMQKLFEAIITFCCEKDGVNETLKGLQSAMGFLTATSKIKDPDSNFLHIAKILCSQQIGKNKEN